MTLNKYAIAVAGLPQKLAKFACRRSVGTNVSHNDLQPLVIESVIMQ